jgi:endogenous inhibitor of DNA gyrase (YacG/DUF329 family)
MAKPLDAIPAKSCAICGKPADASFKPFCSKRCADVDLHRWLSGSYVVPTNEAPDDEEQRPGTPSKEDD